MLRWRNAMRAVCLVCLLAMVPSAAYGKTARNYCNDWSAIGAGSFWSVAGEADDYQRAKGYTVYSWSQFNSSNVYAALQLEGLVISASHAGAGRQVFRNNGSWTCIATYSQSSHKHYVGGYSSTCADWKNIRSISGTDSPCKLVIWMGCNTLNDPGTIGASLPSACSSEGISHAAGFSDTINMDSWARDFAYGYWKSLGAGNLTSKAMDDGTARVKLLHLGSSGGYYSHGYSGSDVRI